jgi:hypothetical protein
MTLRSAEACPDSWKIRVHEAKGRGNGEDSDRIDVMTTLLSNFSWDLQYSKFRWILWSIAFYNNSKNIEMV